MAILHMDLEWTTRRETIAEKIGEICSSHEFETNEIVSEIKELQRSNPQKFSKNLKNIFLLTMKELLN